MREAIDGESIHRGYGGGIGIGGKKFAVNVRASGARTRRMGSGDASHTLSDTDTSFRGEATAGTEPHPTHKKNWRNTEVLRQSLCRVYSKLEGVSETEIGLNEVV